VLESKRCDFDQPVPGRRIPPIEKLQTGPFVPIQSRIRLTQWIGHLMVGHQIMRSATLTRFSTSPLNLTLKSVVRPSEAAIPRAGPEKYRLDLKPRPHTYRQLDLS
jgi:hypothetical protein